MSKLKNKTFPKLKRGITLSKTKLKEIRIAQWGQVNTLYLPIYLATELGFLEQEGLKSKIILAGNDNDIFRKVVSDEADFGVGDPTFCSMEDNQWLKTSVIATISNKVATYGVSINPIIKEITSIEEFAGLKIATTPSPSTNYAIVKYLKDQNKRLLKSFKIIEADIGKQIKLLKKGEVDLIVDIEPFVSFYKSEGLNIAVDFSKFFGEFSFTGVYCKAKSLASISSETRGLVTALNKTLMILNEKDSEIKLLPQLKTIFPEFDEEMLIASVLRIKKTGAWQLTSHTSEKAWENAVDLRRKIGERFMRRAYKVVENF